MKLKLHPGRPLCRHCHARYVSRPRALCWPCYQFPAVRDLYPSTSKYGRKGVGTTDHEGSLPTPCDAPPGSPEKIEVLASRARLGQQLHHPLDTNGMAYRRRRRLAA